MLTKDLAICIRTVDYSETSQIVTFFTKAHGKIGAIENTLPEFGDILFDGIINVFRSLVGQHGRVKNDDGITARFDSRQNQSSDVQTVVGA